MKIEAYAKVNLTLEVLGERSDGYHALRSVVLPVSLCDTLDVVAAGPGELTSTSGYPDDLCIKAALALRQAVGCVGLGAHLAVEKRIPVGGGLGGGSADAAATLLALNELWQLGKTRSELAEIGAVVGSDVPALTLGGLVLMEGRGELVAPLETALGLDLVLVNPGVFCSTGEVYSRCRIRGRSAGETPTDQVIEAMANGNRSALVTALANDLQPSAIELHPEIGVAMEALTAAGAEAVLMSGSGSTVFALAADAAEAKRLAAIMAEAGYWAKAVRSQS